MGTEESRRGCDHRLPGAQVGSSSCKDTVASEVKGIAMSKVGAWALRGLRVRDTELWGRQEVVSVLWKPSRTQRHSLKGLNGDEEQTQEGGRMHCHPCCPQRLAASKGPCLVTHRALSRSISPLPNAFFIE